jgi:PAS domain S-box-containing protein
MPNYLDSDSRKADFFEQAPDLFFCIDAATGVVLECNQTACDELGYGKNEIVGHPIIEFYHADSQESARRILRFFCESGSVSNVELQLCRKDGRVLDISLSASGVREGNKVVRSRSVCRNVSRVKEIQRALKQSETQARERSAELAAVLDALPAMTFIAHDPACLKMTSSRYAYQLLRLPPNSNTSKSAPAAERPVNFRALKDGREIPPEELPVQQAAATGQAVRDSELTLQFEDGSTVEIYGNAVPLTDSEGKVRGAVGVFLDITSRKKAEQELVSLRQGLEERVENRTRELFQAILNLQEVAQAGKESEARMRELSGRLLHIQDDERRRIARDLHDTTGQTLSAMTMLIEALSRKVGDSDESISKLLHDLRSFTRQALNEIRTTSYLLHPPLLDESGFGPAARWFLEGLEKRSGIQITFEIGNESRMPRDVETVLFRVLQESMTNIHRHSGSQRAVVQFKLDGGIATLAVC